MLDDPRSDQFVENFAGQWLQLRKLGGVTPDKDLFPGFDDTLAAGDAAGDRAVLRVHPAQQSQRARAAGLRLHVSSTSRWRGIMGSRVSTGDAFRQVALADRRRGGVLTQASVLTLTSNPNRTSPVKRGQWILQQILGTPPPPPPPDVAKLDESQEAADAASLRERMELHRTKPECISCHQQMDPLGFALENYDAVGRWRTMDGGSPIDPSGELIGGRKFADVKELKQLLRRRGRQEIRAMSDREHVNL